jgi:hypothetical protein
MLQATPIIKPEADEATIFSELFAKPPTHNSHYTGAAGGHHLPVYAPYDIPLTFTTDCADTAHHCGYEEDTASVDQSTKLLTSEIFYDEYRSAYKPPTRMPTMWQSVKNIFTFPS